MTWNDTQGETLSHKCDVRHCASTDGARRAQNCALYTSVCFVVSVPLFAMWFRLFMSVYRSQMFVNMRCRVHSLYKGSSKTPFQYCQNTCNTLLYIRAFQGHTGGNLIEPELIAHVAIPVNRIFLVRQGCSFNLKFILEAGLITGGKESREGRQTVFFTPLDSWGDEIEEKIPR